MTVKVTLTLDKFTTDLDANFKRNAPKGFRRKLIQLIQSGISPVKGRGTFKEYEDKYAKKFKGGRISPVNMTKSGKMLSSIEVTPIKNGVDIEIDDEPAKWHNNPGLARKVRRLFPSIQGEEWTKELQDILDKAFEGAVASAIAKQLK